MGEGLEEGEGEIYAKDGSVDLRGNPVLRSKTGGWTACSFVVGTVDASNNVTNWVGTVFLMPILGAYVADAHLGRYWTFIVASSIYLLVNFPGLVAKSAPWITPHTRGEILNSSRKTSILHTVLIVYMTTRLHQGTVDASNNVTNWVGAVFLMPILGAYVADAHLGRYWTLGVASAIYLLVNFAWITPHTRSEILNSSRKTSIFHTVL